MSVFHLNLGVPTDVDVHLDAFLTMLTSIAAGNPVAFSNRPELIDFTSLEYPVDPYNVMQNLNGHG